MGKIRDSDIYAVVCDLFAHVNTEPIPIGNKTLRYKVKSSTNY